MSERARNLACALAGLALVGLACGRTVLDQPVGADDGSGGALSSGIGGAGVGGALGTGGSSSMGGNVGAGGAAAAAGGTTGGLPCDRISDEMTCLARGAACRADYCLLCALRFIRCANPGDPMSACPPPPPCIP